MKSLSISSFLILLAAFSYSQVVTTNPALPVDNQAVIITFHADQGNKGLMNYSGDDVYAHTGVITDKSTSTSDWKYVKSAWTVNIAACKLTKISANEYQLAISPGIRNFYGVPAGEKILKMAFVFRNTGAGKTGRDIGGADIFANVYEEGLNISFLQPAERFSFALQGQTLPLQINATGADSLFLFLDDVLIRKLSANAFDTSIIATGNTRHKLVAMAKKDNLNTSDTAWYLVPGNTQDEPLPAGLEDGITYPAEDSVIFVLFAPNKNNSYLIGDFNDWLPDSIYQLKKDGDRFWTALGGLIPGKEYAFQYLIDGELRIADPYSGKILDPDNDKYIPATVYPNLLSYPATKTSQLAGVIQPGRESFVWNDEGYSPPSPQNLIIYELLIRDFVTTHDIKDVSAKLDYLQTLGVNAIELMPFSEFEGNSSWGYNPSFYFAPDKYYGRDTDIKDFIQECHNRGIAVIMDMVLNHSYGQNPLVRMYFNSATGKPTPENPWFNETSPNTAYSWGYDFNHESTATQYFVDRILEYWLTEYNIDGFRFDFTKGFTNTPGDGSAYDASRIDILKRIYDKVKSVNTDAYMICEHFAPNSEEKLLSDFGMLLWGNSNYNYNEATMGYLANSDFSWASYLSRGWSNPHLVSYMESHDEERLMYKNITYGNVSGDYNIKDPVAALQRMELAGAFFLTIPGPKMIWQFGELGYDVSIDFNGRVGEKPVKWDYFNNTDRQRLYLTWAKILDIRKKYPVFQTDDYTMTVGSTVAGKKIVLRHAEEDAIVVGNFGLTSASVQPGYTKTGWWYEIFSGDSLNISDVSATVTLNPGEYRLYASRKMESVISGTKEINEKQLLVYPNPVSDRLNISLDDRIEKLEVFDLSGISVLNGSNIISSNMLDVSDLKQGLYLLRIQAGGRVITGKFVKR
jgi:glycosidase